MGIPHFWRLPIFHTTLAVGSWLAFVAAAGLLWCHNRDPKRPLSPTWRRVMLLLGWVSLVGRTTHDFYIMLSPLEPNMGPLFQSGQVHAIVGMTAMFDLAVPLSVLPVWLRGVQLVQRASVITTLHYRYIPVEPTLPAQLAFLLWHGVLPWVAVLMPFVYIHLRAASARSKQAPAGWASAEKAATCTTPPAEACSCKQQHAVLEGDGQALQGQRVNATCNRSSGVCGAGLPAVAPGKLHGAAQPAATPVSLIRQMPYQRKLGPMRKACLKLYTEQPCDSLPADVALVLQQALHDSGYWLRVVDLAVRPGCITLTFSLLEVGAPPLSQLAGPHLLLPSTGSDPDPDLQNAEQVAHSLMPQLQQLLPDLAHRANGAAGDDSPPTHLLQVGDHAFTLAWCAATSSWLLEPRTPALSDEGEPLQADSPATEPTASGTQPWLGMALVQPQQPQQDSPSRPPSAATAAVVSGQGAPAGAASSGSMLQLVVEVQAWELGKLAEVEGWEPPAPGAAAPTPYGHAAPAAEPQGPALQLLARGGGFGGYLVTRVLHVSRAPDVPRLSTVQVLVEVPPQLLVRHHPGGPPSSLQLLTLELWQGEVCLSSCPLLTAHVVSGSSSTSASHASNRGGAIASGASPCTDAGHGFGDWWWGARDMTVAAAVLELAGVSQCLAAEAGSTEDVLRPYLAFLRDLSLWLVEARTTSLSTRTCWAGPEGSATSSLLPDPDCKQQPAKPAALPPPAWLRQPCLPRSQQQQLAAGLLEFAAAVGLKHVHSMVAEQLRHARAVLSRDAHKPRGSAWKWTCMAGARLPFAWLAPLRDAMLGFPCHLCEQQYQQHLVRVRQGSLAAMQALLVLLGVALSARSLHAQDWTHVATSVPWTLLHLRELLVRRLHARSSGPPATQCSSAAPRTHAAAIPAQLQQGQCGRRSAWGPVLPWLWRVACRWLYGLGLVRPPAILTASRFQTLMAWPLLQLTLALTEQVQASTVLPAAWVLLVACGLDMPATLGHYWATMPQPASFWLLALTMPLMSVAPRVLLDAHARRRHQAAAGDAGRMPHAARSWQHLHAD